MLQKIEIRNFKAIKDEPLVLDNLTNVNYLVGPNGCGKSSVLEYLFQNGFLSCSEFKISKETVNFKAFKNKWDNEKDKQIVKKIKDNLISFEISENDRINHNENVGFNNSDYSSNFSDYFYQKLNKNLNFEKIKAEIEKNNNLTYFQNHFNHFINPSEIKTNLFTYSNYQKQIIPNSILINFEEIIKIDKEYRFNEEEKVAYIEFFNNYYFQNNKVKDINKNITTDLPQVTHENHTTTFIKDFATGYQNLFSLYYAIKKQLGGNNFNIFLIEEPENGLHPNFQKLLPKIFADLSEKYFVTFLISTHSPFIISSAAKEDGQKVYLIEKGQTKDAKTGELNTERSKSGYSGGECLFAVNEMLGSDINDIVPHTIFFCERSLKILLEKIFEKTDSKPKIPLIFTDIAGDDERIKNNSNVWKNIYDSIQKADKVKNILNYNIYGIIDQCQKADGWKKSLGEKLIIINDIELENLYKKDLVNQFLKDTKICQTEWKGGDFSKFIKENNLNKGEIKNRLAEFIGSQLNKEFVKEISQELHDCIFNQK